MQVPTYTKTGGKASSNIQVNSSIYGLKVEKHDLLKKAYLSNLAAKRSNSAKTKLRGEVRGGGRKPWRQKGTGNARVGSIRSPLWRGGGITFGPRGNENYSINLSSQEKKTSLKQALSIASKKIVVIDDFGSNKTKEVSKIISKISNSNRIVVVCGELSDDKKRGFNNLENTRLVSTTKLSVNDVIDADSIVLMKSSLDGIAKRVGGEK